MLSPFQSRLSSQIQKLVQLPRKAADLTIEYYGESGEIASKLVYPKWCDLEHWQGYFERVQRDFGCVPPEYRDPYPELIDVLNKCDGIVVTNSFVMETLIDYLVSSICDPAVKSLIIRSADFSGGYTIKAYSLAFALNYLFQLIRSRGLQINLDHTDLSDCDLAYLNLEGLSAIGADFSNTRLYAVNLQCGNLSRAKMSETINNEITEFHYSNLYRVNFSNAIFGRTQFCHSTLTGVDLSRDQLPHIDVRSCSEYGTVTGAENFRKKTKIHVDHGLSISATRTESMTSAKLSCENSLLNLSPMQSRISENIFQIVPQFPKVITKLIGTYCFFPGPITQIQIKLAQSPIETTIVECSKDGRGYFEDILIADPDVTEAIERCLTSPDCDPAVKSKIMGNFFSWRSDDYVRRRQAGKDFSGSAKYILEPCCRKVIAFENLWQRILSSGMEINLNYTNLSYLNISNVDLRGISAVGAKFIKADLTNSCLANANLTSANFSDACLAGANCLYIQSTDAIYQRANLRATRMDYANLINANFYQADLNKASLKSINAAVAQFRGAKLNLANLRNAILEKSDLTNAVLIGAVLENTNFNNSNLRNADLTDAIFFNTIFSLGNDDRTDVTGMLTGSQSMGEHIKNRKKHSTSDTILSGKVIFTPLLEMQTQKGKLESCIIS